MAYRFSRNKLLSAIARYIYKSISSFVKDEWDESKHPRDEKGRFANKGTSSSQQKSTLAETLSAKLKKIKAGLKSGTGRTNTSDSNGKDSLAKHMDANGNLTPEREKLHEEILLKFLKGVEKPDGQPVYTFLGGGSASGKSTVLNSGLFHYRQGKEAVAIDADAIKTMLPEYQEMVAKGNKRAASFVHEESSALAKRISAVASENGYNVSLDGTGDGSISSMKKKIQQAKDAGMRVEAYYVSVPTKVAIERAKARGEKTGRVVKTTDIKNIHKKVSQVFPQVAGEFDHVELFDNTDKPIRILSGDNGKIDVLDEKAYNKFLRKAGKNN